MKRELSGRSAIITSLVASLFSFIFGVFLSPIIVPKLQSGLDTVVGCKREYEKGRRLIDREIIPMIEAKQPNSAEKIHAFGRAAHAHFEAASQCKTPLGSNALISMAMMHCGGLGVPKVDKRRGQLLIFEAGSIPGSSAGRIFTATISCRNGDTDWIE